MRRFALTQLLLEVQLWFPVWLIFLTDRGFSITTAVLADATFRLTVVGLELPLGLLADRIGRRRTQLLIAGTTAPVFVAMSLVTDLPALIAVWIAWGALWALSSGSAASYLYELVREPTVGVEAGAAFGFLRAATSTAVLISHLLAGVLYRWDARAPFLLTAGLGAAALMVTLGLPEVAGSRRGATTVRAVADELRRAWAEPLLRLTTSLSVLLLVLGWSVRILFQPLILDLGLSPTAAGAMYFAYSALAVGAGLWSGTVGPERRPTAILAGFVILTAAVLGTGAVPVLGPWLFVPLIGFGYYGALTLLEISVNEASRSAVRATLFSGISLIGGLAIVVARPSLGALADRASAAVAFAAWGVVGLAVAAVAAVLVGRVRALDGTTSGGGG